MGQNQDGSAGVNSVYTKVMPKNAYRCIAKYQIVFANKQQL